MNLESVAGSAIQATCMVKFEDGLRTGVLQEDCWCPCGGHTNPLVNIRVAKHNPGGGVDGVLRPFGKPNSNCRVPHSKVLILVHLVGMLWCKKRHLGLAKGNLF